MRICCAPLLSIPNYFNIACSLFKKKKKTKIIASFYLDLQLGWIPGTLELIHNNKDCLFYLFSCVTYFFSPLLPERGKTKLLQGSKLD